MSDYFGALLRSSGAAPTAGRAGRRAAQARAPFGDDAAAQLFSGRHVVD